MTIVRWVGACWLSFATIAAAQKADGVRRYPVPPAPLGDAEEIALARSAAPDEVSSAAAIYVLRGTDVVQVVKGTNGCACMVGRDSHDGSRYPICFDREGASTNLYREIMQTTLRAKGRPEQEVQHAIEDAYANGTLKRPNVASLAYMMSPRQVLFSVPDSSGVRVGAWSPHVMLTLPSFEPSQLGLAENSHVDVLQIHAEGTSHAELIVKVPKWSDGTPVSAAPKP